MPTDAALPRPAGIQQLQTCGRRKKVVRHLYMKMNKLDTSYSQRGHIPVSYLFWSSKTEIVTECLLTRSMMIIYIHVFTVLNTHKWSIDKCPLAIKDLTIKELTQSNPSSPCYRHCSRSLLNTVLMNVIRFIQYVFHLLAPDLILISL